MNTPIWQKLKKPIFILAPMEDVTDTVFRRIVAQCGKPDLFFTEFTSTAGLLSKGRERVMQSLLFTPHEKPLIAQIWGSEPENFYKTAKIIADMGFDGIDINMGCPVKKIISKGSCGGLIRKPSLAKEIIQATKEGAGDLPVSVKTRIGFSKIDTENWISFLLAQDITALTVHARTVAEMSKVPAHWDEIGKAVKLRDKINKKTLIIGNGDIQSRDEGLVKCSKYKADGVMIGRGIFHNPWIFSSLNQKNVPFEDRINLLINHIHLYTEFWKDKKPYEVMKKYYKIYISGFENASELRMELMRINNPLETIDFLKSLLDNDAGNLHYKLVKSYPC